MEKRRRTVVEVRDDLHREMRKLAILNDLRIYELANAVIEEAVNDHEKIKLLIQKTKSLKSLTAPQTP